MNEIVFEKIKTIKNELIGVEDELYQNQEFIDKQNYYNQLKTKFIRTQVLEPIRNGQRRSIIFPKETNSKYIYKNLRFPGNNFENKILSCELEIGGSKIDKIYGSVFKILRYLYKINDDCTIPFYFCSDNNYLPIVDSDYRIIIETEIFENLDYLLIDIYEIIDENIKLSDFLIMQLQFCGEEIIQNNKFLYENNFNHVVSHLFIECGINKINNINLKFIEKRKNIDMELNFDKKQIIEYDNHYLINLTKSIEYDDLKNYGINFSIDGQILINFENIDSKECKIYALSLQAVKINQFFFALYYSK